MASLRLWLCVLMKMLIMNIIVMIQFKVCRLEVKWWDFQNASKHIFQVQCQRICRGAPPTAGGEIQPCLLFTSNHWGETSPTHLLNLCTLQAFVVAGGHSGPLTYGSNDLSSVLTLLPGATAWTPLASLPRAFGYAHASIVGGKMRVTGGYDGSSSRSEVVTNHYSDAVWVYCWCDFCPCFNCQVLEYQPDQNKWSTVGNLQVARYNHAVLSVGPNQLPCL